VRLPASSPITLDLKPSVGEAADCTAFEEVIALAEERPAYLLADGAFRVVAMIDDQTITRTILDELHIPRKRVPPHTRDPTLLFADDSPPHSGVFPAGTSLRWLIKKVNQRLSSYTAKSREEKPPLRERMWSHQLCLP